MNEQATTERPADARTLAASTSLPTAPTDIAAQLERDIKSLELTGSHLEGAKGQAFYNAVAADMRQAVQWLRSWDARLRASEVFHQEHNAARLRQQAFQAVRIAANVRDLLPATAGEPAVTWRAACCAIHSALLTLRDSGDCK